MRALILVLLAAAAPASAQMVSGGAAPVSVTPVYTSVTIGGSSLTWNSSERFLQFQAFAVGGSSSAFFRIHAPAGAGNDAGSLQWGRTEMISSMTPTGGLNIVDSIAIRKSGNDTFVDIGQDDNDLGRISWDDTISGLTLKGFKNGAQSENVVIAGSANGLLGVAVSSPATTLDVGGNAQFGSGAFKSTFTASGQLNLRYGVTATTATLTGGTTQLIVSGWGPVTGAGSNQGTIRLGANNSYNGQISFDGGGSNTDIIVTNMYDAASGSAIRFKTRGNGTAVNNMTLHSSGNVGIGVDATLGFIHADKGTGVGQLTLDGSTGGCIMLRDTDDAGWTECDALDGTLSCSVDADGVCD